MEKSTVAFEHVPYEVDKDFDMSIITTLRLLNNKYHAKLENGCKNEAIIVRECIMLLVSEALQRKGISIDRHCGLELNLSHLVFYNHRKAIHF